MKQYRKERSWLSRGHKEGKVAWCRGVQFFLSAARAGEDITAAIASLKQFFKVNVIGAEADIARTLLLHSYNKKDVELLAELLGSDRFNKYVVDAAIETLDERVALYIFPQLPGMLENSEQENFHLWRLLKAYITQKHRRVDRTTRLEVLLELFAKNQAGKKMVPRFLEYILSDVDISAALNSMKEQLLSADKYTKYAVTNTVLFAISAGCNVSRFVPALERALGDTIAGVRLRAAQDLVSWGVLSRRLGWRKIDKLLFHKDVHIRQGAIEGLEHVWLKRRKIDKAFVSRVARALADSSVEVRKLAAEVLVDAERDGLETCSDDKTLRLLIRELSRNNENRFLESYLRTIISNNRAAAKKIAAYLSSKESSFWSDELGQFCREALKTKLRPCAVCKHIPREVEVVRESDLPREFSCLEFVEKRKPSGGDELMRCPCCNSYFIYNYWYECDVNCMFEEFSLKRLSPTKTLALLKGKRKQLYNKNFSKHIKANKDKLSNYQQALRIEAAWILAEHYVKSGELEKLTKELLLHPDRAVIKEALTTFHKEISKKKRLGKLKRRLCQLLRSDDADLRSLCAKLLLRDSVISKKWSEGFELLNDDDVPILRGSLVQLAEMSHQKGVVTTYLPNLLSLIAHPDETVSRLSARALRCFVENGPPQLIMDELVICLKCENEKVVIVAIRELGVLARLGQSIESAINELVELVPANDVGRVVVHTLYCAAIRGMNVSRAHAALAQRLTKGDKYSDEEILKTLRAELKRDVDISKSLEAVAGVLGRKKVSYLAAQILKEAAQKDLDVAAVLSSLSTEDICNIPNDPCALIIRTLTFSLLRGGRWLDLLKLFSRKNHRIRGTMCAVWAEEANKGKDISPTIEPIIVCLGEANIWSEKEAFKAALSIAKQSEKMTESVLTAIEQSLSSRKMKKPLVKKLIEACCEVKN